MKTILIPTEDHDAMPAVLEAARLVAERFDSYMEGFAVHPAPADFVAVDPVSSLTIASTHDNDEEVERGAQRLFEGFMRTHHVPEAKAEPAVYSHRWVRREALGDAFIGSHGRLFDLIALGRPGRAPHDPRMPPLEAALFESGRPVLIAPSAVPTVIGRNMLIAWNGSTEQTRTTAFALPLLHIAETVTLLSVEGGMTPGPTGEDFARYLRRNGVAVTAMTVGLGKRTTGEVILDYAKAHGCDLLVKGAYTQSRLRQMVFGGATRHILASATLPVLMAH
ncbi:MAG: universal stress protein [Xanthobacteraceae bacterium]|nr:universal stress protein [Xanthobacteraceae bacterium]